MVAWSRRDQRSCDEGLEWCGWGGDGGPVWGGWGGDGVWNVSLL